MNKLIIIGLLFAFNSVNAAEILDSKVVKNLRSGLDVESFTTVVGFCLDKKCKKLARTNLRQRSSAELEKVVLTRALKNLRREHYVRGFQVDGTGLSKISLREAITYLRTDYTDGDGDEPISLSDAKRIVSYVKKNKDTVRLFQGSIMINQMGGTGIYGYIFIWNYKTSVLTTITKFEYAE